MYVTLKPKHMPVLLKWKALYNSYEIVGYWLILQQFNTCDHTRENVH